MVEYHTHGKICKGSTNCNLDNYENITFASEKRMVQYD